MHSQTSRLTAGLCLIFGCTSITAAPAKAPELPRPENVRACTRQWRIDLYWDEGELWRKDPQVYFEVQRSENRDGPFRKISKNRVEIPAYCDFFGRPAKPHYYRVRTIRHTFKREVSKIELDGVNLKETLIEKSVAGKRVAASPWSEVVSAHAVEYDEEKFLLELQETCFLYFWNLAHPVSGLPSENLPGWNRNLVGTSGTGFSVFNYIVGVERGFITRQQGAERVLKMTDFLLNKVRTFWGVYPHWLNGETGEIIPLSKGNDGSDLLETAFMVMGLIGAREYFDGSSPTEKRLRKNINSIWHGIDWASHAAVRPDGMKAFHWVWSPSTKGFYPNLYCSGFSENHMTYLLALSSPTHRVSDDYYHQGWESPDFIEQTSRHGVEPTFTWGYRISLFPAHFAYMALDPKQVHYQGKSYFDYLQNLCLAQYRYIPTQKDEFKGYEHPLWGLSAGCSPVPGNFKAHAPSDAWEHSRDSDNGTLTPSAALSSFPYLPSESKAAMTEMFTKYGKRLWGPYGPYDAFNLTRNWYTDEYICINVAPVAPMIENHLTGKCWEVFTKTPEIAATLKRLRETEPK